MTDYSYIGVGKIFMRVKGSSAGRKFIGNCSKLDFNVNEDVKEMKDHTAVGGGTWNETRRINSVEGSITIHDISPTNLARAILGAVTAIAAGTVTDEQQDGYQDSLMATSYPIDTSVAPVVEATNGLAAGTRANSTPYSLNAYLVPAAANGYFYKVTTAGTSAGSPPTFPTTAGGTVTDGTAVLTCMGKVLLVVDTDYTVSAGGILLTSTARITDGQAFSIDYTKDAGNIIQALVSTAQEYELLFDGLNEALSGKPVIIKVHRHKFGAAPNLSWIGEDYAGLELTGKVLKDTTITGTGLSQYYTVTMVD